VRRKGQSETINEKRRKPDRLVPGSKVSKTVGASHRLGPEIVTTELMKAGDLSPTGPTSQKRGRGGENRGAN